MTFDLLRPSLPALVRAAQQALADRTSPAAVPPVVTWQGISEADDAFTARVTKSRARLAPVVRMFAVCSGPRAVAVPGVTWCELPPKLLPLLHPAAPARYRVAYGGRGGAKSWAMVRALLMRAVVKPVRMLCFRELQASIAESIHQLLRDQIETLGLSPWFTVQATSIFSVSGAEFIFSGIRSNPNKIRSLEGVDIAFGEEAAGISEESWTILVPTIRKPGSEVWVCFNPDAETDPTYKRFVKNPPDTARSVCVSYLSNPWLPAELMAEQEYLAKVDPDAHAHVWLGQTRAFGDACIFKGKFSIEAFTPEASWSGPYFGADWGFAVDPTTLVKCWIKDRTLYVEFEAYGVGVDTDQVPALFDQVPDARKHWIRADSARPETISFVQRHGYGKVIAVSKWSGSVEDGIQHMRSFERIAVHPRCVHAAEEFRLYSYRTDRLTGDVMPDPLDRHNHVIDAIRYALVPLLRRPGMGFFDYMRQEAQRMETEAKISDW